MFIQKRGKSNSGTNRTLFTSHSIANSFYDMLKGSGSLKLKKRVSAARENKRGVCFDGALPEKKTQYLGALWPKSECPLK
jgi:hypothetical protein